MRTSSSNQGVRLLFPKREKVDAEKTVTCLSDKTSSIFDRKARTKYSPLEMGSADHETLKRAGFFTEETLASFVDPCKGLAEWNQSIRPKIVQEVGENVVLESGHMSAASVARCVAVI